jgi:hypothetical protein
MGAQMESGMTMKEPDWDELEAAIEGVIAWLLRATPDHVAMLETFTLAQGVVRAFRNKDEDLMVVAEHCVWAGFGSEYVQNLLRELSYNPEATEQITVWLKAMRPERLARMRDMTPGDTTPLECDATTAPTIQ